MYYSWMVLVCIVYVLLHGTPKKWVGCGLGGWGSVLLKFIHNPNPSSELQGWVCSTEKTSRIHCQLQVDNKRKVNSIIIPILYQSRRSKVQESPICNTILVKDLIFVHLPVPFHIHTRGSKLGFLSQRFLPQQGSRHPLFGSLLIGLFC